MLVLGHRGFPHRQATENTLEAFQRSLALGADGIEFDVRVSRDGEMVLVHDVSLSRIAGDGHAAYELSADELARIPLRHGGRIQTLHDVTSHIHAPAILDMEIKDVEAANTLVRKLQTSQSLRERTIISSFHEEVLIQVQSALPDIRTLLLVSRWPLPLRGPAFWIRLGRLKPWAVGFPGRVLQTKRVQALREGGFAVAAWDLRGTMREAKWIKGLQVDVAIVKRVDLLRA
ncbi:glycerophosphodiester phosphodiesterase [Candidatus Uhrbacteria bacterium]|nr:glycerophosphodiester phosphodiesterase [Candidatus Uhrbacteria bacterium]